MEKKKEFMEKKTGRTGVNRVFVGVAIFLVAFGFFYFYKLNSGGTEERRWEGGNYNVGKSIDYSGTIVTQKAVDLDIAGGKVMIPLDDIIESSFVYGEYRVDGVFLPLTAYIAPSGRVVGAVSYCEPCRSSSFHIRDNELVCDSCYTRWEIETLKGIAGGCMAYPPEEINYQADNGMIILDENDIRSWTPRDLQRAGK
ncbi:MAG: Fe-S-containing protein [Bacillota bacterium]